MAKLRGPLWSPTASCGDVCGFSWAARGRGGWTPTCTPTSHVCPLSLSFLVCAKGVALTAHGGRSEDGRSQWAQGEHHTLVQGGALCWEGEHCGCQPRPLWGPGP